MGNPYNRQDIQSVLERSYEVKRYQFNPGSASGANIGTVKFPDDLYAIPNIVDKLSHYKFLRADVEVEIKVNATQFHIGSLNISHASHRAAGTYAATAKNRRNMKATVMPLSSVNSIKFVVPRLTPTHFDNIRDYPSGYLGSVFIDVLDPLLIGMAGAPTALDVSVFARFINSEVAGYGYTDPSPTQLKSSIASYLKTTTVEKHSKQPKNSKEADKKVEAGVLSGIMEAVGTYAPLALATPFPEIEPVLQMIGTLAPFARAMGLSKPVNPSVVYPSTIDHYRDLVTAHGLSQGTKLSLNPDSGLGDTNMSQLKRHEIIKDIAMKPSHIFRGFFTSTSHTPDSNPVVWRCAVTPGLSAFSDSLNLVHWSYMAYVSQFFKYWRGGIKFRIEFNTSSFTTARVRVSHTPDNNALSVSENYSGDTPSAVIDIRGPTVFETVIPYLSQYAKLPVPGPHSELNSNIDLAVPYDVPRLFLSVVSPANIPDPGGNSTIYYNVYASAAEDFQLDTYQGFNMRQSANWVAGALARPLEKHSLDMAFSKPFVPLIPAVASMEAGLVTPERPHAVEEVLKRFGVFFVGDPNGFTPFVSNVVADLTPDIGRWSRLFQFWRGSLRFKVTPVPDSEFGYLGVNPTPTAVWTPYTAPGEVNPDGSPIYSNIVAAASVSPPVEFEVPWDCPNWAMSCYGEFTDYDFPEQAPNFGKLEGDGFAGVIRAAVGEDFVFGSLVPPPPSNTSAPSLTTAINRTKKGSRSSLKDGVSHSTDHSI